MSPGEIAAADPSIEQWDTTGLDSVGQDSHLAVRFRSSPYSKSFAAARPQFRSCPCPLPKPVLSHARMAGPLWLTDNRSRFVPPMNRGDTRGRTIAVVEDSIDSLASGADSHWTG
jgi:hypothetical protein